MSGSVANLVTGEVSEVTQHSCHESWVCPDRSCKKEAEDRVFPPVEQQERFASVFLDVPEIVIQYVVGVVEHPGGCGSG